jgi:hypothetical protein
MGREFALGRGSKDLHQNQKGVCGDVEDFVGDWEM